MKIAFVIYDGMTLLDFAGVYDPLTRLRSMGLISTGMSALRRRGYGQPKAPCSFPTGWITILRNMIT